MSIMGIAFDDQENIYRVFNTFDGVVCGQFCTHAEAEEFAWTTDLDEQLRIHAEYG